MTDLPDPHAQAQVMADLLAGLMEGIKPISEACNGYRLQMEREGWSAEQANLIAGEMHLQFIRFLFESMKGAISLA